jgi:hypothetical protein
MRRGGDVGRVRDGGSPSRGRDCVTRHFMQYRAIRVTLM